MTNQLKPLTALLPPPKNPVGLGRTWLEVERELGVALPSDFKDFVDKYGTGLIAGAGSDLGFLHVWNFRDPDRPSIVDAVSGVIKGYEDAKKKGYASPYPFYPAAGGLLPFASTPDGDYFNWRTVGSPPKWDVVFYFFDVAEMILLKNQSFSQTLIDLLSGHSSLIPATIPADALTPPCRFTMYDW